MFSRRILQLSFACLLGLGSYVFAQEAGTFLVRDGALPWHDRVGRWQLADVPAVLQHDEPVQQQSCGSRGIQVPAGTAEILLAAGRGDAEALAARGIALRSTDLQVTIASPDGKTRLPYPVFVCLNPPETVGGEGICNSGVVLLRLSAEGIQRRTMAGSAPLVAPEKNLAERQNFHLYLLIGQSNMAGRGTVEAQDLAINPRVLTLDKDNRWVVAVDPIHFDKSVAGVGLGTTFGKVMAGRNPNAVIGLIPCAAGGTRVEQWQKDAPPTPPWGQLYENAVKRTQTALRDGVLKGILWHQGEGNSSTAGIAAYRENLTRLVADLRLDLDAENVPFVAGELGVWDPEKHASRKAFNDNLAGLPTWFSHAAVVSSAGLSHRGDNTHFCSEALREFGRRSAEAMLRLQAE